MDDQEHVSRGRAAQVLQQGKHLQYKISVQTGAGVANSVHFLRDGNKWKRETDLSISFFSEKRRSANGATETQAPNHVSDPSGQGTRAGTQEQLGRQQNDSETNASQVWILMDWISGCRAHIYLMWSRFCWPIQKSFSQLLEL